VGVLTGDVKKKIVNIRKKNEYLNNRYGLNLLLNFYVGREEVMWSERNKRKRWKEGQ